MSIGASAVARLAGALAMAGALGFSAAASAEPLLIGVAAPLSGPNALVGGQVAAGARAAVAVAGPERASVDVVDDACTAEGGSAAAARFVEQRVTVVVGFLCAAALDAAMPALKAAGIAVVTVGVRANRLTDDRARTGWPVVRLAPRADAEREAVGRIVTELWREKLFAIVDDGTIYGRELAESVRAAAEEKALKPVFTDTFRPGGENQLGLVGRLNRAGAAFAFVGGDREDIAVMGRDAAKLETGLTLAGGEAMRAEAGVVALEPGTLMIGLPEWSDEAAPEAVAAVWAQGAPAEGYALPAYAAAEIAMQALANAPAASGDPSRPFLGRIFGTAIGPVSFDGKGDLAENPYRLFRFDGRRFVPEAMP